MLKLLAKLQLMIERRKWADEVLRIYPTKHAYHEAIARRITDMAVKIQEAEVHGYRMGLCQGFAQGCEQTVEISRRAIEKRFGGEATAEEIHRNGH